MRARRLKVRYIRCSWGLLRRERDRARATLSRTVRHEPRHARSWRVDNSWQWELREEYGLESGSSTRSAAAVAAAAVEEFGGGDSGTSMLEAIVRRWIQLQLFKIGF